MTNSAFLKLLSSLATILKADAALVDPASLKGQDLVQDPANIRPYFDTATNAPGGLIVYGLFATKWDVKYRRGEGELQVNCEHPESAAKAEAIMERFRTLVRAGTLTAPGVRVALFEETPQGQLELPQKLAGYCNRAAFKFKLGAQ